MLQFAVRDLATNVVIKSLWLLWMKGDSSLNFRLGSQLQAIEQIRRTKRWQTRDERLGERQLVGAKREKRFVGLAVEHACNCSLPSRSEFADPRIVTLASGSLSKVRPRSLISSVIGFSGWCGLPE